jgi:hypothetical protein
MLAAVSDQGYVVGVRLLDDAVRAWDAATFETRQTVGGR